MSDEPIAPNSIKLSAASVPNISQAFLDTLQRAFPPLVIETDTPMNVIMYNAGQRKVLEYIERFRTNAQRS